MQTREGVGKNMKEVERAYIYLSTSLNSALLPQVFVSGDVDIHVTQPFSYFFYKILIIYHIPVLQLSLQCRHILVIVQRNIMRKSLPFNKTLF